METEFQSRIADRKHEYSYMSVLGWGNLELVFVSVLEWGTWSWYLCLFWSGGLGAGMCVCSGVGDLELVFVPPGAAVSGLEQTYSGVYVDEAVHYFVCHADFV